MNKTIFVSGATGFIGGSLCIELKQRGYKVIGLDLVRRPYLEQYMDEFYHCDVEDIISKNIDWKKIDAFIHCAGTSLVYPSFSTPLVYYYNNVSKTANILSIFRDNPNVQLLFSSSASVYKTKNTLLKETDPLQPLSPYAKSKHMIEQMLNDFVTAYKIKVTIFRYFNACGAMGSLHGQEPGATHIFPKLFENDTFELYGDDYNTPDKTCVRDYIHVRDIVNAHIRAIELSCTGTMNLGCSFGYSNKEIISEVEKSIGKKNVILRQRREGDADSLVSDATEARHLLNWAPVYTLKDIVSDLIEWYKSDNFKTAV